MRLQQGPGLRGSAERTGFSGPAFLPSRELLLYQVELGSPEGEPPRRVVLLSSPGTECSMGGLMLRSRVPAGEARVGCTVGLSDMSGTKGRPSRTGDSGRSLNSSSEQGLLWEPQG